MPVIGPRSLATTRAFAAGGNDGASVTTTVGTVPGDAVGVTGAGAPHATTAAAERRTRVREPTPVTMPIMSRLSYDRSWRSRRAARPRDRARGVRADGRG